MQEVDIAIIGGGCAGMSAALGAYKKGVKNILILERNACLGGVLKQCIHNGFGIHRFRMDLTGTEYAKKYIDEIEENHIPYLLETAVLDISKDRIITAVNPSKGLIRINAKAIILAMGCRERSRGALAIPGTRPAGIFSAGTAQRYLNLEGYMVGRKIVILGSGDIGLIMARQFALEGAEVLAVAEIMPYSGGLLRNIVQCLDDFDIPLYLNTTVVKIEGHRRVSGVWLARVDKQKRPVPSTMRLVECDTLILSVGLIPENELTVSAGISISESTGGAIVDDSYQTDVPGIFSCGNVLHVHDLVDYVSIEGEAAGENAASYVLGASQMSKAAVSVIEGFGIRGAVPQKIRLDTGNEKVKLQFRPDRPFGPSRVNIYSDNECIYTTKKQVMTPGEMCQLSVPVKNMKDKIRIEVEPLE